MRPVSEKMLEERKVNFPRKDLSKLNINIILILAKKTLIFDLDETLVHC